MLAIRKPIDEIPAAVNAVARAFLIAALAGLALTLILGDPAVGDARLPAAETATVRGKGDARRAWG